MSRSLAKILAFSVASVVLIIGVTGTTGVGIEIPTINSGDGDNVTNDPFGDNDTDPRTGEQRTLVVDQYVVTEINPQDNSVTITAEINDSINTEGLQVTTDTPPATTNVVLSTDGRQIDETSDRHAEHTLTTNAEHISYTVTIDDSGMNNEFVSDQVVFLRDYGLQFNDKSYAAGTDSISIGDGVSYSSVHTYEDNIAVYESDTTVTNITADSHNMTIVAADAGVSETAVIGSENIVQMFEDDEVPEQSTLFILPPEDVRSGGLAMGHADDTQTLWVSRYTDYELQHTTSHEVAHAHQDFGTGPELEWFTEGSAEYLATYATSQEAENLNIATLEFNEDWYYRLSDTDDVQLSDQSTWERNVQYNRGEHVSYLIDVSLRHHTNGDTTIVDLIQWMNDQGSVDYPEFREYIVEHTDEEFGEQLDSYSETTQVIDISEESEEITGNDTVRIPN